MKKKKWFGGLVLRENFRRRLFQFLGFDTTGALTDKRKMIENVDRGRVGQF